MVIVQYKGNNIISWTYYNFQSLIYYNCKIVNKLLVTITITVSQGTALGKWGLERRRSAPCHCPLVGIPWSYRKGIPHPMWRQHRHSVLSANQWEAGSTWREPLQSCCAVLENKDGHVSLFLYMCSQFW